jgi:hypothetical protein
VISSCPEVTSLTAKKDGRELQKRSLQIVDTSCRSVEFTLWGELAVKFEGEVGSVIAIKNARIGEYMNAKTLSAISSTQIDVNPQLELTEALSQWYLKLCSSLSKMYLRFSENADTLMTETKSISSGGRSSDFQPSAISTFAEIQRLVEQASMEGSNKAVFRKVNLPTNNMLNNSGERHFKLD